MTNEVKEKIKADVVAIIKEDCKDNETGAGLEYAAFEIAMATLEAYEKYNH